MHNVGYNYGIHTICNVYIYYPYIIVNSVIKVYAQCVQKFHTTCIYSIHYHISYYPWAVYCDRPTQLYLKGRGRGKKIVVRHFPEASAWGVFVRIEIPAEISGWGVFFGRRFTVKAHSTNTNIWILIYRFLKYRGSIIPDENSSGRSLWKVFHNFLRIIFARKLALTSPAHRT